MNSSGNKYQPTIKDILLLPLVGEVKTNPEGTKVAYRYGQVNLKKNSLDRYLSVFDIKNAQSYYLMTIEQPGSFFWLNNENLAIKKNAHDNSSQIVVFENLLGEGFQVTDHKGGITEFYPFADGFVYIANNPEKSGKKERVEEYGNFIHVEEEESNSSLYYVSIPKMKKFKMELTLVSQNPAEKEETKLEKPLIELGKFLPDPVNIESVIPSPKGDAVYINCKSKDDLLFSYETSFFRIQFDPEEVFNSRNENKPIVTHLALPQGANISAISPDGSKLLIKYKERDLRGWTQTDLWILNLLETENQLEEPQIKDSLKCITNDFDEDPFQNIFWNKAGIFFSYWDESYVKVAKISETGDIEEIDLEGLMPESFFHVNDSGCISFSGISPTKINDCYVSKPTDSDRELMQFTCFNDVIANWDMGTVESIKWTSKDGTEIEGVLRKPSNFDPNRKYPLLFKVHGGPHYASPNTLLEDMDQFSYPVVQFSHKDILVLKPNYRGSLGRGKAFKELLIDNVGVGDLWDLESAIDHLVSLGFVDETKIGTCGGSQGAYISAFAAMHSDRFCAASGLATLSSWYTYWSGSDCRFDMPLSGKQPFRSGSPFEEDMKDVFIKTAPISGIEKAKTPLLLQHGENDQRVPINSAKELYRALKEKGVQTELFIYPGMGHSIFKPRENYGLLVQNYRWFCHHLLGEELDFFKDDESE